MKRNDSAILSRANTCPAGHVRLTIVRRDCGYSVQCAAQCCAWRGPNRATKRCALTAWNERAERVADNELHAAYCLLSKFYKDDFTMGLIGAHLACRAAREYSNLKARRAAR